MVESLIGHGSYGEVYKVRSDDDVTYALKCIKTTGKEDLTRIANLIKVSIKTHIYIPHIMTCVMNQGRAYVCTIYVLCDLIIAYTYIYT